MRACAGRGRCVRGRPGQLRPLRCPRLGSGCPPICSPSGSRRSSGRVLASVFADGEPEALPKKTIQFCNGENSGPGGALCRKVRPLQGGVMRLNPVPASEAAAHRPLHPQVPRPSPGFRGSLVLLETLACHPQPLSSFPHSTSHLPPCQCLSCQVWGEQEGRTGWKRWRTWVTLGGLVEEARREPGRESLVSAPW